MLMVATSGTAVGRSGRDIREIAGPSLDGNPDGLSPTLGLDDLLLQAVEPDTAVNDLTYKFVLTYEDAAFSVFCGVARVDTDAIEFRHAEQDGQPLLELGRE